jgi:hypothetical protein
MIKYSRFFILIISVCLAGSLNPVLMAQSASCAICGRTHEQIMTIGHEPTCKYYVAPGTGKTKSSGSSGSSGNSSDAAGEALMQGVVNSLINAANKAAAEQEEADRLKEEAAARREAEAKEKRIAEEKAKDEKLKGSYKPIGGISDKKEPGSGRQNFVPVSFNCKITTHRGEITIRNAKGETHILRENENIDIHVGDIIKTGQNSSIRMHFAFEKGGEDVTYGSNTTVRIVRGEDGTQQPEVLKGKLHSKSSRFEKEEGSLEKDAEGTNPGIKKIKKQFKVKTPTTVVSPRGTDFTVSVNDLLETEVVVLDGSVDLMGIGNDTSVLIEAGYTGRVSVSGSVSGPEKTDLDQIEKWWIEK